MSLTKNKTFAYLVSEYPKISHTFIQREIDAVRSAGYDVVPFSIRTPSAADIEGAAEKAEYANTSFILDECKNPLRLAKAHFSVFKASPRRYFNALTAALRHRPAGVRGLIYGLIYFTEAGVVAQKMREKEVDHLHTHFANSGCTVAMLASEMSDIDFSFTMHGPTDFFAVDHFSIPEKLKRAKFVSCISHFCRSQMMLFCNRSAWNKLHIIRCGVFPEVYENENKKEGQTILFVGRMAGVKGAPLILESATELKEQFPNVQINLVGDGPERSEIESRVAELGLTETVHVLGSQTQEQVAELMKDADIFTLPSFSEGLPVVLMEALASSTPVVTTQIAGISELVENGKSGFVINAGSQQELTEALLNLMAKPNSRRKMGDAGRKKVVAEFDVRDQGAKIAALLAE